MMTKDGLIFKANSLKQGRLQALTRQQLQAQATQNRERRWGAPSFPQQCPEERQWNPPSQAADAWLLPIGISVLGKIRSRSLGSGPQSSVRSSILANACE